MKTLFDPVQAGLLQLANRIVMAPLTRNRAPGALPTPLMELPGIVRDYRRAARSASNRRTDSNGDSIENRARLLLDVTRAIAGEIGGGRTSIRLSPVTPANDAFDPHPQALFSYGVQQLAPCKLAYLHIIEGSTGGPRDHVQSDTAFDSSGAGLTVHGG